MAVRIGIRRDTSENWTEANPVLGVGEPGYDTTVDHLKIGDGQTAWNDLPFFTIVTSDLFIGLDTDDVPYWSPTSLPLDEGYTVDLDTDNTPYLVGDFS